VTFGRDDDLSKTSATVATTPGSNGTIVGDRGRSYTALGLTSEQLRGHARRAFQASERLLRQAEDAGAGADRFFAAANRYAATLRTLGDTATPPGELGGPPPVAPAEFAAGVVDPGTISLINHSMKEALDALQLKRMVRALGESSQASRALMTHAQQMDDESWQTIDALAGGAPVRTTETTGNLSGSPGRSTAPVTDPAAAAEGRPTSALQLGGGRPTVSGTTTTATAPAVTTGTALSRSNAAVQQLVQQSRDVLQAIRELDRDTTTR